MPVIGLLRTTTAAPFAPIVAQLRKGLSEERFIKEQRPMTPSATISRNSSRTLRPT